MIKYASDESSSPAAFPPGLPPWPAPAAKPRPASPGTPNDSSPSRTGSHTSGSLTEDRFWEAEIAALLEKLLDHGNDAPLDGALDHLWQTNSGAYDVLIERIEGISESVAVMQGDLAWDALLVAAPVVAWSKYAIASGPIARDDAQRASRPAPGPRARRGHAPVPRALSLLGRPAAAPLLGAAPAHREALAMPPSPARSRASTSRACPRPRSCSPTRAS